MTLVLLDTNAYLRLAKRIKPLLGVPFGQKGYQLTVLKAVEDEVHRSTRLQFHYPWFDDKSLAEERLAKRVRLSKDEKAQIDAMSSVLRAHVLENAANYTPTTVHPPHPPTAFASPLVRCGPPSWSPMISACTYSPNRSRYPSGMAMNC